MVDSIVLLNCVLLFFIYLVPGFALKKFSLVNEAFAKGLSTLILYVLQPAMLIVGFIDDFKAETAINILWAFLLSMVTLGISYIIAVNCFKGAPPEKSKVLQYAALFPNAGYIGMPLITAVCGAKAAVYVTAYVISFNIYAWSLGCLIYTHDKSFISPKKILLNPATIPIYIGLIIYLLPINTYVPQTVITALNALKDMVAPCSMLLVGIKLADIKFKGLLNDMRMWGCTALRLLAFPAISALLVVILKLTGVRIDPLVSAVTVICSATPCATATCIFAEKFDCDATYAGKIVSVSTLLSVITIPLVSLLLNII